MLIHGPFYRTQQMEGWWGRMDLPVIYYFSATRASGEIWNYRLRCLKLLDFAEALVLNPIEWSLTCGHQPGGGGLLPFWPGNNWSWLYQVSHSPWFLHVCFELNTWRCLQNISVHIQHLPVQNISCIYLLTVVLNLTCWRMWWSSATWWKYCFSSAASGNGLDQLWL